MKNGIYLKSFGTVVFPETSETLSLQIQQPEKNWFKKTNGKIVLSLKDHTGNRTHSIEVFELKEERFISFVKKVENEVLVVFGLKISEPPIEVSFQEIIKDPETKGGK